MKIVIVRIGISYIYKKKKLIIRTINKCIQFFPFCNKLSFIHICLFNARPVELQLNFELTAKSNPFLNANPPHNILFYGLGTNRNMFRRVLLRCSKAPFSPRLHSRGVVQLSAARANEYANSWTAFYFSAAVIATASLVQNTECDANIENKDKT